MLSNRILLKWCPAFQDLVGQWKIYNSFITTRFQVFNTLVQTSSAWWWVVTFFLIRELHFLPAKRLQIHHEFCPTFTSLTNLPGFTTEKKKEILFNENNYQHFVKNTFFLKHTNSRTSGVVSFHHNSLHQNPSAKRRAKGPSKFRARHPPREKMQSVVPWTVRTTGGRDLGRDDLNARVDLAVREGNQKETGPKIFQFKKVGWHNFI